MILQYFPNKECFIFLALQHPPLTPGSWFYKSFPALGLHRNVNQLKLFPVVKFIQIGHVQITFYDYCIVVRIERQSMVNVFFFINAFNETSLSFTMHLSRLMDFILCKRLGIVFCKGK